MRILLVCPMPPSREAPGAIPPLLHAAAVGLRERHELTIACVAGPDPGELAAVAALRAEGFDVRAAERRTGGTARRVRRAARWAWDWGARRIPWRSVWYHEPRLQDVLDGLPPGAFDVVAVEDDGAAGYRFPAGVPRVLTEHEVARTLGPEAGRAARIDHARWPRHQREIARRFDLVGVFTRHDLTVLEERAPEVRGRVRVVPFGIELPTAATAPPVPGTVLFAGNYTHPPNVDAALWIGERIAPCLRELRPDARLRLAGIHAPPRVHALQGPGIEVLGAVPDLDAELHAAAVVLAPVRTGGGMRMKVLHALASGAAVVTTSLGAEGLREYGEPPLRVADDSEGLARAIAGLLEDEQERARLGHAARQFAERHYGPAAYAARLEAFYREGIERHLEGRAR